MTNSPTISNIAELMRTDPHDLSDRKVDEIIEAFRGARHQFNKGNMKAGSTKKLSEKQKLGQELSEGLSLKGLLGDD